jgi:hypothetical protein
MNLLYLIYKCNGQEIGLSPINEYNIEGLFDMELPTLFPKSGKSSEGRIL